MQALSIKCHEFYNTHKLNDYQPLQLKWVNRDIQSWGAQIMAQCLNFPLIHCSRMIGNSTLPTTEIYKNLGSFKKVSPYFFRSFMANTMEISTNRFSKVAFQSIGKKIGASERDAEYGATYAALVVSSLFAARYDFASIPTTSKSPTQVSDQLRLLPLTIKATLLSILMIRNSAQMQIANPLIESTTLGKLGLFSTALSCHLLAVNALPVSIDLKTPNVNELCSHTLKNIRSSKISRVGLASGFRLAYSGMVAMTASVIIK